MENNKPLKIGVTLHYRDDNQSIWENGIFQNCFFLVKLLRKLPNVDYVAILIDKDESVILPESLIMDQDDIHIIGLNDGMEYLNTIIEMSALLPDDWAYKFRLKGGKYYWMRVGNDFFLDVERALFNKPSMALVSEKEYDCILTIPEYQNSCLNYFETTARAPVKVVPHLWSPYFLDHGISQLPNGAYYGFRPLSSHWRVAVLEANLSLVKTSLTPLLAIENAYRKNPSIFNSVGVNNSLELKEVKEFVDFALSLDIVKHGITFFDGRMSTPEFASQHADMIVTHHWENGQNYLYYELLHGNYPLIHNSTFIGDCGYKYNDFDAEQASSKIEEAYYHHKENLGCYRSSWDRLKFLLSPDNENNIKIFKDILPGFQ